MESFDYDYALPARDAEPSAFQYLTKVVLPAGNLVAVVVLAWSAKLPGWGWRLPIITVGIFVALTATWPAVTHALKKRRNRVRDAVVASREFPRFMHFVRGFGDFVGNQNQGDTLHMIVQSGLSDVRLRQDFMSVLDQNTAQALRAFWEYFVIHCDRPWSSLKDVERDVSEFNNLVGQYYNLCVNRVFPRLPSELSSKLAGEDKSKLEGFRQRHQLFVDSYRRFLRELSESTPGLTHLPRVVMTADPLVLPGESVVAS